MENFETVEVKDLLDIENFAKNFKKRRIELKFTQKDVATFCSDYYNHDMSQTTVSRFEALELSFNNTKKLTPYFQDWLEQAEKSGSLGEIKMPSGRKDLVLPTKKQRNKRTSINANTKLLLQRFYKQNPHPRKSDIQEIAAACNLKENSVRNWFNNHRSTSKIKTEIKVEREDAEENSAAYQVPSCSELNTNCQSWESPGKNEFDDLNMLECMADSLPSDAGPKAFQNPQSFEKSIDPTGSVDKFDGFSFLESID